LIFLAAQGSYINMRKWSSVSARLSATSSARVESSRVEIQCHKKNSVLLLFTPNNIKYNDPDTVMNSAAVQFSNHYVVLNFC